ncbi:hypothetical protein GINT2_000801 [Glugoides intestinalis]
MKRVFEGQMIKTLALDYDFIEIKGEKTRFIEKTCFFNVPSTGCDKKSIPPAYLIVNYFKIISNERTGLLAYDEFAEFDGKNIECVYSDVFVIEKPVIHQEFYKTGDKYLFLDIKTDEEYEIDMETGTLIAEDPFYKVHGSGKYIFRTKTITYAFQ